MYTIRTSPFLQAWWLAARNGIHRDRLFVLRLGIYVALAIGLLIQIFSFGAARVEEYEAWIVLVAALHATHAIASKRQFWRRELKQSWLAATPRGAATVPHTIALRTCAPLALTVLIAIVIVFALALSNAVHLHFARRLAALMMIAACVGGALGWYLGRERAQPHRLSQRFTFSIPNVRATTIVARLWSLSRWPIAQVQFWSSPKALRWPFIAACMSVPLGSSAGLGVLVVGTWALVLYMGILNFGVIRSARDAARWLLPTPISFAAFAFALIGRAFAHQLIATAIMASMLIGANDRDALEPTLRLALLWMSMTTVVSVSAVAFYWRSYWRGWR